MIADIERREQLGLCFDKWKEFTKHIRNNVMEMEIRIGDGNLSARFVSWRF